MNTPDVSRPARASKRRQRGVAAVEFGLIAFIFFNLLLGIVEFGRWMFTLNAANEATRLGARLAVVCSISSAPSIKLRMSAMAGGIASENMTITYLPSGCDEDTCKTVIARIDNAIFTPVIPYLSGSFAIPSFPVSLPREYMNSTGNPVCPSS